MEISVVIATYADPLGLYLTFFSLLEQLEKTNLTWEIIISADGGTSAKWEKYPNTRCLRIQTGSPQGTRDAGIRAAKYADILCIESHVVVSDIETWLKLHQDKKASISFPSRIGETTELFTINNTETNWDGDLWIKKHFFSPDMEPRRVSQFGHAAFMIDRDWYYRSGGYTLEQKGWGGEEPYLCLKTWMLGGSCWIFPKVWMAHYLKPGAHTDYRNSDNFIRNIDIVKYVIAGQIPPRGRILPLTKDLLLERQKITDGPFGGDIEKLKEYFKKEGIA